MLLPPALRQGEDLFWLRSDNTAGKDFLTEDELKHIICIENEFQYHQ